MKGDNLRVLEIIAKVVLLQLLIQALVFAVTSYFILKRLRVYFSEFYYQYRCILLVATIGFTVSLSARALFNLSLRAAHRF